MDKVTRIRAGLYEYTAPNGDRYTIENRQTPADYGSEWLWYISPDAGAFGVWFDPAQTKADALHGLRMYYAA
jgi:hypothetical protein